jgi:hypothetical protein
LGELYIITVTLTLTDCLDIKIEEGEEGLISIKSLRIDRTAIVKFKRHSEVLYGMKQLRGIEVDGQALKVARYHPATIKGDHEIDEDGEDEKFDQYSLRTVMRDYMHSDPATR